MRCLFLAPLKPPDDPEPSGDRLIAGLFLRLLGELGFEAVLASRLRTRCREPGDLAAIERRAAIEFERIVADERQRHDRAALVFTYHNNYRAPDLLGPRLARELGLPYVLAESSRAPKRAGGPFDAGHRLAEASTDAARLVIAPTAHDMVMLERLRPEGQQLLLLPPFLDEALWPAPAPRVAPQGPLRLATAGMMRAGRKAQSHLALAAALTRIESRPWTLDVAGDGEARAEVEAAYARFGSRVRLRGALHGESAMRSFLRAAEVFAWPAIEEPFGMVFLEAQSQGLPCLAYGYRGVPDVVADGIAGHLVEPGDEAGFAGRLAAMIDDRKATAALGRQARRRFEERHTLHRATEAVAAAFRQAGLPLPR